MTTQTKRKSGDTSSVAGLDNKNSTPVPQTKKYKVTSPGTPTPSSPIFPSTDSNNLYVKQEQYDTLKQDSEEENPLVSPPTPLKDRSVPAFLNKLYMYGSFLSHSFFCLVINSIHFFFLLLLLECFMKINLII